MHFLGISSIIVVYFYFLDIIMSTNSFFKAIWQKITSSVCVAVYAFSLFASLILSITSFLPDVANALTVLPNDLSITKTLSGTVYPGAIIESIIDYSNNGSSTLSWISITDSYSDGLSFNSIVSSNPDLAVSPILFSHDIAFRTLRRDNITLGANANGQIIIRYIVSTGLAENTDVSNAWSVWISCVLCQDPYTMTQSWLSVAYVTPNPIIPPLPYDLQLQSSIPAGMTYTSGDFIDVVVDLTNDNYTGGDIMLEMNYKTYLMEFVGVVSWISLPTPIIVHPNNNTQSIPRSYNSNDTSRVSWHGFYLDTGINNQITLRFKMINDYTTPVSVNFNLGIPNEYDLISTIGESNDTNNTSSAQVQWPEFDLWTTVSILTGDESSPWIYSASWTVTFRIQFGNNGPARDNIILSHEYLTNNFISYTWDRDYGLFITWYGDFSHPESWWWYRRNISLWENEIGYIDITYRVHDCGNYSPNSRISIIDNYQTALSFSRPWENHYFETRGRELDISNNIASSNISSDWTCIWWSWYTDDVIGTITNSASGDVVPGQKVTFWVPFQSFMTNNDSRKQLSLAFEYGSGLSFLWVVSTGINHSAGIVDKMTAAQIAEDLQLIQNPLEEKNWDLEYIYNNPWSFATGVCWFSEFPTGTPLDNPFPLRPYIQSVSGMASSSYLDSYALYVSLGYDDIRAHVGALIDAQTTLYSNSHVSAVNSVLHDAWEWYYPCVYQQVFTELISNWANTGQAATQANQAANEGKEWISNRANLFNLCEWDKISVNRSTEICDKNEKILWLFYDPSYNPNDIFRSQLDQTISDAYAVWLSTSWFHQLLTNRIVPLYSNKPIAREYSMIASGNNGITFCSSIECVENYYTYEDSNTNPYPSQWLQIGYYEYAAIKNEQVNAIYSGRWIPRNGGFVKTDNLRWIGQDLFVDNFSQSGQLLISHLITYAGVWEYVVGLEFVVNEIAIGSALDVMATIWYNRSCNPSLTIRDHSQGCLIAGNVQFEDSYDMLWWYSGDSIQGEDNSTWSSITVGYREPYDLSISKIISDTDNILPGDLVDVTTIVCNNGSGRSDISVSESYLPGMVFLNALSWSTLWVLYSIDPNSAKIIRSNISLANGECKQVITQYQTTNLVTSGMILNFASYAGNFGTVSSAGNTVHSEVSGGVIAPDPTIYSPYGNKEILSSTFLAGDEIIYRINYSNPGSLTWIMNLYDIYESGLIFSGIVNSSQGLVNMYHNLDNRMIMWTGVVLEPWVSHSIDLSFIISTGKLAFESIRNNFAYDMLFIPESYIADADKTNNSGRWVASYSLNILQGTVLDDVNGDDLLWGDAPLSWVVVWLSQSSILIATTLTSSTGSYVFTGLLPWLYTLTFTAPSWYVTTRSFTGVINNGILDLNWVSINALFNGYSSSSTDNATLMRTTTWAFCGNNTVETWEVCDDGANNGLAWYCNNSCSWTSPVSLCGNGVLNGSEQCDDGNNTNGDACSASCQYEMPSCSLSVDSYQSLNPLAVTVNLTGFGFWTMQILSGLTYGDSNSESNLTLMQFVHSYNTNWPYTITATVANRINSGLTQTCSISVQGTFGGGGSDPYCGNNIREGTEECDGGLLCNSSCEIVIPVCTGTGCEVIHTVAPIDPPTTGSTKRILYVRDDVIIPKYIKILPHAGAF